MYNQEMKNKYLDELNNTEDVKEIANVLILFQKSGILEERYGKDLVYFNKEQMVELLKMFNLPSISRVRAIQRRINRYFTYYAENYDAGVEKVKISADKIREIANSGDSPLAVIRKEEFNILIDRLIENNNAQCAFSLVAAWSGLMGYALSEISLIKMDNIDKQNNTLKVYAYNSKEDKIFLDREIFVSDLFIKVAILADKEMEYVDDKKRVLGQYEKSDYITKVRVTSQNKDREENDDTKTFIALRSKILYSRLNRLKKSKGFYIPNINFESVRRSGIAATTIEVANLFGVPLDKLEKESNSFVLKLVLDKYKIDMTYMRTIISTHILKI